MKPIAAVDLGPNSGRVMKITLDNTFQAEEVHRFPNQPVYRRGHLRWNIQRLWGEVIRTIEAIIDEVSSIGICSWGVDYGLLDKEGNLLEDPVHYRDPGLREPWTGFLRGCQRKPSSKGRGYSFCP